MSATSYARKWMAFICILMAVVSVVLAGRNEEDEVVSDRPIGQVAQRTDSSQRRRAADVTGIVVNTKSLQLQKQNTNKHSLAQLLEDTNIYTSDSTGLSCVCCERGRGDCFGEARTHGGATLRTSNNPNGTLIKYFYEVKRRMTTMYCFPGDDRLPDLNAYKSVTGLTDGQFFLVNGQRQGPPCVITRGRDGDCTCLEAHQIPVKTQDECGDLNDDMFLFQAAADQDSHVCKCQDAYKLDMHGTCTVCKNANGIPEYNCVSRQQLRQYGQQHMQEYLDRKDDRTRYFNNDVEKFGRLWVHDQMTEMKVTRLQEFNARRPQQVQSRPMDCGPGGYESQPGQCECRPRFVKENGDRAAPGDPCTQCYHEDLSVDNDCCGLLDNETGLHAGQPNEAGNCVCPIGWDNHERLGKLAPCVKVQQQERTPQTRASSQTRQTSATSCAGNQDAQDACAHSSQSASPVLIGAAKTVLQSRLQAEERKPAQSRKTNQQIANLLMTDIQSYVTAGASSNMPSGCCCCFQPLLDHIAQRNPSATQEQIDAEICVIGASEHTPDGGLPLCIDVP